MRHHSLCVVMADGWYIPPWVGTVSTDNALGHCCGRNSESATVDPVTMTAGILIQSAKSMAVN